MVVISLDRLNELNRLLFRLNESLMNVTYEDNYKDSMDEYSIQLIKDSTEISNFIAILRNDLAREMQVDWNRDTGSFVSKSI